jgi:16S rRNA C967 or C1407 C5-methylase (RsmB/RsmF family)/NOL1/NOP2/fmu family ribosome biogenesis protein
MSPFVPPVPPAFLERMARLLGPEFPAFLAAYEQPPVNALRANTAKIAPRALRDLLPLELEPVPWSDEAFLIAPGADDMRPGKHPYHAAGLYYLQEPSALAPVELLDPQLGERVLDLAAAPGGKGTHIAARMQALERVSSGGAPHSRGVLVANEIHPRRAWDLAENLERFGARHAAVSNETPERLAGAFGAWFDAVLVDAPCSGEGMFRKSEAARQEWARELVTGCALRQAGILDQASRLVRPGGRLVYSTCTFAPEEDEETVARFLNGHPDFELIEPERKPGFVVGRPEWAAPELRRDDLARCVRLWPHLTPGEGHFAALLRRQPEVHIADEHAPHRAPERYQKPDRAAEAASLTAYREFCAHELLTRPEDLSGGQVSLVGSYLYAIPPALAGSHAMLAGLRTLHPGWWLGVMAGPRKDRFEPSHALALGLRLGDARLIVDLPPDSRAVDAYLRGHTLTDAGANGWVLVGVGGYPLGWARRVDGRLKSHYPKGLRPV